MQKSAVSNLSPIYANAGDIWACLQINLVTLTMSKHQGGQGS